MFDAVSYIMGQKAGSGSTVVIQGDIVCTDDGSGNVTISLASDTEEVESDGE